MAKLNKFIVEYAEVFKGFKINPEDTKPPRYLVKRFVKIIKVEVNDPRYENMCIYPLETILSISFLAVLTDAKTWGEIADFGNDYRNWLKKFIPIGKTMPIDDTYRRVFSMLDSTELSKATIKYITSIFRKIKKAIDHHNHIQNKNFKLINIDGKEARGTGRMYNSPEKKANLHTLNVYDASDGVSLFSIPIPEKSNEIPEAQKILNSMNLKNTIVTLDSLHAQHKTFEIIMKHRGDYVIGVKGNQHDAFNEIKLFATDELLNRMRDKNTESNKVYVKYDDYREYFKIPIKNFAIDKNELSSGTPKWSGLRNIICYRKVMKKTGVVETKYFATSLNDLELSVEAIIGRWDVENLLHRYLDMDFGEDSNKTMDIKAYTNLSIINKLCLSILKIAKPLLDNRSMRRIKKSMSRKLSDYLSLILTAINPDELEKILTMNDNKK